MYLNCCLVSLAFSLKISLLLRQVCEEQILLVFNYLRMSFFCLNFLKLIFLDIRFLVDIFLFEHFNYIIPLPVASIFSDKKSAVNLIWVPLFLMSHFSLAVFQISSLSLAFNILNVMCLGVDLYTFI